MSAVIPEQEFLPTATDYSASSIENWREPVETGQPIAVGPFTAIEQKVSFNAIYAAAVATITYQSWRQARWVGLIQPADQLVVPPLSDITKLGSLYSFDTDDEKMRVRRFVLHHDIAQVLLEAYEHIRTAFGDDASFSLEIHSDPEEDFEGLFIIVKTDLSNDQSIDEVLERLDKFYDEWWLDIDPAIREIVGIDIEHHQ